MIVQDKLTQELPNKQPIVWAQMAYQDTLLIYCRVFDSESILKLYQLQTSKSIYQWNFKCFDLCLTLPDPTTALAYCPDKAQLIHIDLVSFKTTTHTDPKHLGQSKELICHSPTGKVVMFRESEIVLLTSFTSFSKSGMKIRAYQYPFSGSLQQAYLGEMQSKYYVYDIKPLDQQGLFALSNENQLIFYQIKVNNKQQLNFKQLQEFKMQRDIEKNKVYFINKQLNLFEESQAKITTIITNNNSKYLYFPLSKGNGALKNLGEQSVGQLMMLVEQKFPLAPNFSCQILRKCIYNPEVPQGNSKKEEKQPMEVAFKATKDIHIALESMNPNEMCYLVQDFQHPGKVTLSRSMICFNLQKLSLFLMLESGQDWQDEMLSDALNALDYPQIEE